MKAVQNLTASFDVSAKLSSVMRQFFTKFTSSVAMAMGHAWVFIAALAILLIWALSGPLLGFSDTWQLVINTSTTIITFLMVFIIQNTQNRDNLALNLKLDVMMRKLGISRQDLLKAEDKSDSVLENKVKKEQSGHEKTKGRGN